MAIFLIFTTAWTQCWSCREDSAQSICNLAWAWEVQVSSHLRLSWYSASCAKCLVSLPAEFSIGKDVNDGVLMHSILWRWGSPRVSFRISIWLMMVVVYCGMVSFNCSIVILFIYLVYLLRFWLKITFSRVVMCFYNGWFKYGSNVARYIYVYTNVNCFNVVRSTVVCSSDVRTNVVEKEEHCEIAQAPGRVVNGYTGLNWLDCKGKENGIKLIKVTEWIRSPIDGAKWWMKVPALFYSFIVGRSQWRSLIS